MRHQDIRSHYYWKLLPHPDDVPAGFGKLVAKLAAGKVACLISAPGVKRPRLAYANAERYI